MASPLSGIDLDASGAATATPVAAPASERDVLPMVRMGKVVFCAYMLVQLIEYGGLGIYVPFLKASRLSTVLSYLLLVLVLSRYKGLAFTSRHAKLFGTFVIFTGAGIMWAVVKSYVPTALRLHVDYFGLFIVTAFIVDSRHRARVLSLAFAAITMFLVVTNRNMMGLDIRFGSFAAPYFMGDGNDFGWGLTVMLPFSIYLMLGKRSLLTRMWGLGGFAVGVVGIIGTESRGATLALGGVMLLFLATVSKRKLLFVGVIVVAVLGVALLAPPSYFARMNTIKNYEDDSSAQGRLRAWKAARQMALDYPLGVGANNFNSAYGRFYIPADPQGYAAYRWMSTHSCYFKVLAEYGYPGLLLFLSILFVTARDNVRSARRLRAADESTRVLDPEWPLLLNVALLGYAICGLFLGGITYPHLYLLGGLSVATTRVSLRQPALLAAAPDGARPDAAPGPPGREPVRGQISPPVVGPRQAPDGPGRYF